jgi:hypothetical protein
MKQDGLSRKTWEREMKNMLMPPSPPQGPKVRKRERDLKHQCWVVLRKRDRYLSVINSGIYSLPIRWFSKYWKN